MLYISHSSPPTTISNLQRRRDIFWLGCTVLYVLTSRDVSYPNRDNYTLIIGALERVMMMRP